MIIAVDLGTTHVKAAAFDATGTVITSAERRTTTVHTQPGWSEQDPDALFLLVLSVLQDVLQQPLVGHKKSAIQGIVFSSAMHGLVAVDRDGRPLTPLLLWSDLRADAVARAWRHAPGGGMEIYHRTGVPVHAMSPVCKLVWLREHQPDIFRAAYQFLGIKEYVWYRLTGHFESDISCASATGLMNLREMVWDEKMLSAAGIQAIKLPLLAPPVHTRLATFPMLEPIPLILGASDGALANLGAGATRPGHWAVTIGTSAAIRCVTEAPVWDDTMRTFCYRLDAQRFIVGGGSNNGANVLDWLRDEVFESVASPEAFLQQAAAVPPGADGLLFLPYLQGERAPLWDASARGAFLGLAAAHRQAHFIRAAMEGVLFNLKMIADSMTALTPMACLYASGGFSRNALWVQMLADIFQAPVRVSQAGADASVLGALELAKTALGIDKPEAKAEEQVVHPDPARAEAYQIIYQNFIGCIPH